MERPFDKKGIGLASDLLCVDQRENEPAGLMGSDLLGSNRRATDGGKNGECQYMYMYI